MNKMQTRSQQRVILGPTTRDPEGHDESRAQEEHARRSGLPAAESYLSLLMSPTDAARLVDALRRIDQLEHHKAKDVLRASGLPLLAKENTHVASDLGKVKSGKKLSPVLLVRGQPLQVADGYHRLCASYYIDENADIPCRIVDGPRR